MKRVSIALVAIVAWLMMSCHDEPVVPAPTTADATVHEAVYQTCGAEQQVTVIGNYNWHKLLDSLLSSIVDSDCQNVHLWCPDSIGLWRTDYTWIKTTDRQKARSWCEDIYSQGYDVWIRYYNEKYTCSAAKYDPKSNYTPMPLAEYLPGTWVLDTSVEAEIDDETWITPFTYSFEYGYTYPYHEYMVFTESEVYLSYPDTTCTYSIIDSMSISISLYNNFENTIYESDHTKIYQISEDRMLVKGYIPTTMFSFSDNCVDWNQIIYLFHRQH